MLVNETIRRTFCNRTFKKMSSFKIGLEPSGIGTRHARFATTQQPMEYVRFRHGYQWLENDFFTVSDIGLKSLLKLPFKKHLYIFYVRILRMKKIRFLGNIFPVITQPSIFLRAFKGTPTE